MAAQNQNFLDSQEGAQMIKDFLDSQEGAQLIKDYLGPMFKDQNNVANEQTTPSLPNVSPWSMQMQNITSPPQGVSHQNMMPDQSPGYGHPLGCCLFLNKHFEGSCELVRFDADKLLHFQSCFCS